MFSREQKYLFFSWQFLFSRIFLRLFFYIFFIKIGSIFYVEQLLCIWWQISNTAYFFYVMAKSFFFVHKRWWLGQEARKGPGCRCVRARGDIEANQIVRDGGALLANQSFGRDGCQIERSGFCYHGIWCSVPWPRPCQVTPARDDRKGVYIGASPDETDLRLVEKSWLCQSALCWKHKWFPSPLDHGSTLKILVYLSIHCSVKMDSV